MFILLKSGAMFNLFWLQDCFQGKHNKNVVIFYCINGSKVIEEYDTEAEARQRVEDIRFNMSESSAGDTRPLIVEELPTEHISTRRSYLIKVSEDPEDGYQEWRYLELPDGTFKWDMLGITKDYAYSKEEIDEQFENYYTITEVDESQQTQDTNIQTNADDIDALETRMNTAESNIQTNTSTIVANKTDIEGKLSTEITNRESADTELGGRITTNANNITSLGNRVTTNEGDIAGIKAEQLTQNTNISTNTSTIATNKADIEGKLNTAKTELENVDTALSGRITTNANAITEIQGVNTTQNGRLDDIESDIADIKTEQGTQNTNITSNATSITNLTTTVSNNKLDIEGKLTNAVSDLEDADEVLGGRLTTAETKLETIEEGSQVNIIEKISVNNTEQTITNKGVNITVPTTTNDITNNSGFITKEVNNLTNYTLAVDTASTLDLSIDSSTYVLTMSLKNSEGTSISTKTVDLPLETMVVDADYDTQTKEIILTLQSGSTTRFSVADLVSGLQSEITSTNKLDSDLVDDTNQTNKFVTSAMITKLNGIETSAQINVLEGVKVNGTSQTITNKEVDIVIPTKTSDLTNDSGYLTQHQSLANYYNKDQVDAAIQSAIDSIIDGDEVSY